MKTSVVVLAVLSLAILVSVSGGDVVQAREGWLGPDVVAATNGLNPGEAVITWNRLAEGFYYRVGWVAQADREVGADGDARWREGFVFADVANRGHASHLITGLTPGVEYDFVVASHDGRHARLRPPETYASLQLRQDPAYSPLFDSATAEVALSPAGGATHYRISWTTKADYDAVPTLIMIGDNLRHSKGCPIEAKRPIRSRAWIRRLNITWSRPLTAEKHTGHCQRRNP